MKFEKLNTKVVVAIGVAVILVLTLVFIIFNTDLIVNHKKDNSNTNTNSASNTETISDEAKDRTKDVNDLNSVEKKYLIEQNFLTYLESLDPTVLEQMKKECVEKGSCPIDIKDLLDYVKDKENPDKSTTISGCSGKLSYTFENGEVKVDMSGVVCSTKPNTNTNYQDPEESNSNVYDGTGKVPENVENREKYPKQLSPEEKNYIVSKNMQTDISGATGETVENLKAHCIDPKNCEFDAKNYNLYSDDSDIGYFITGCTGKINVIYVPGVITATAKTKGALKVVKDTDNLKANEIRLSDALPHLSSTKLQTGDYVKKTKVKAYVAATAKTKGALKVVSDKKKPAANEIRFSNVKYRVYSVEIKEGDYVAVEEIDAYVATTADDKDALKVVADFRTLEAGQFKISSARPFIDTNPIKVGDYVIEGTYVTDTSKVVCKQG